MIGNRHKHSLLLVPEMYVAARLTDHGEAESAKCFYDVASGENGESRQRLDLDIDDLHTFAARNKFEEKFVVFLQSLQEAFNRLPASPSLIGDLRDEVCGHVPFSFFNNLNYCFHCLLDMVGRLLRWWHRIIRSGESPPK